MINIQEITANDLKKEETYSQLKELVKEHSFGSMMGETLDTLRVLEKLIKDNKKLEENNPSLYNNYQDILIELRFICLPLLPKNEVLNLFRTHFLSVFKYEVDISSKLELFFSLHSDDYQFGELRKLISNALSNNEETLGINHILENDGKKANKPTIKNWIRDFLKYSPANQALGSIDEMHYFNSSKNTRRLSSEERDNIIKIIQLYNYLVYPEKIDSAVRQTGHRVVKETSFPGNDTEKVTSPKDYLSKLKIKYEEYRAQRWKVLQVEDKLTVQTKGDFLEVKKEISQAIRGKNTEVALAGIVILARQKTLSDSLKNNPSWIDSLSNYIITKFSRSSQPEEIKTVISSLKYDTENPAVVAEFLQFMLIDKIGLDPGRSAMMGVEVGQLLGGEFEKMAYGNQETGEFEWAKSEVVNGKLVAKV